MLQKFEDETLSLLYSIKDPRSGVVKYPLDEIIFLVIVGVLSGCTDWEDIIDLGELRLSDLRNYLPYYNGIPSISTLARVISLIDSDHLTQLLREVSSQICKSKRSSENKQHLALDGKHLGNNFYSVSVYCSDQGIVLDQSNVYGKGHELSAIRQILDQINCQDSYVTIDAIACQQDIIAKIKAKKANAIIAVKANQKYLYKQITRKFELAAMQGLSLPSYQDLDKNRGRVEIREVTLLSDLDDIPEISNWPHVVAIAQVNASRSVKGKTSNASRYFLLTESMAPDKLASYVRRHWHIENKLHWVLDVNMKEDSYKKLAKNARNNLATIKRIVLNIIKEIKEPKKSLIATHRKIARDPEFMKKAIQYCCKVLKS